MTGRSGSRHLESGAARLLRDAADPVARVDERRLGGAWNVERLRTYRLGRARGRRSRPPTSGAVLLFDFNNIRYSRAPTSASGPATR